MRILIGCLLVLALAWPAGARAFSLTSPEVTDGGQLPQKQVLNAFGCAGGNVSPELDWRDPPAGTKSFVLTLYDPDAPTDSGWWHWVVFNIPATADRLLAGAGSADGKGLPAGAVASRTDFGQPGYGGACPPAGDPPHRYIFTLHALDVDKLDLPADSSPAMVEVMMNLSHHQLGKATLTAKYGR